MRIPRRKTRTIKIGNVPVGSRHPVLVQSMAKTKASDIAGTLEQIRQIRKCGCVTVRLAVKDEPDAMAIKQIKRRARINLIADIHFDHRLALLALENGADKIRLNPGNIYKRNQVKEVVKQAQACKAPIRVGVNSGSVVRRRTDRDIPEAMVRSALSYIRLIDSFGFDDIVVSLKASSVIETISAYRKIAPLCDYPLHLGITASGLPQAGILKSALGIGILLSEGIGDTIRVSLTAPPSEEVMLSHNILQALGIEEKDTEVISCPTCGRCSVDLEKVVRLVEGKIKHIGPAARKRYKRIAVMGCMVNGPGEAKQADIGIAFGGRTAILFKKGRPVKKVSRRDCVRELIKRIKE